jgi:hypothetical protein
MMRVFATSFIRMIKDHRGGQLTGPTAPIAEVPVHVSAKRRSSAAIRLVRQVQLQVIPVNGRAARPMKTIARSQENYWTNASGWTSPDEKNAVMYFDLLTHGEVDLNGITRVQSAARVDGRRLGMQVERLAGDH